MLNPVDKEHVLELSKNKEKFRLLMSLSETGGISTIDKNLTHLLKNIDFIKDIITDIPGLPELLDEFDSLRDYLNDNKTEFLHLYKFATGDTTEETKQRIKSLKQKYGKVSKWSTTLAATAEQLRNEGLIPTAIPAPNLTGKHYKAALAFAKKLSPNWFIKRISLFGSVAQGKERPDSDIDILVEVFDFRAVVGHTIDWVASELSNKLKLTISPLLLSPKDGKKNKRFFQATGFFDAILPLFERTSWEFKIGRSRYLFDTQDYLDFRYDDVKGEYDYFGIKFKYPIENEVMLVLKNNKPLLLSSGLFSSSNTISFPVFLAERSTLSEMDLYIVEEMLYEMNIYDNETEC